MAALIETVGSGPIGDFELFDHFVGAVGNEPICLTKRARAPHRGYSGIPRQVVNTDYIGDDERVLVRYLLGDLTEEEQVQVEASIL